MKSYNEVADDVFRRRDEHMDMQSRRAVVRRRFSTAIAVIAIVLVFVTTIGTSYVLAVNAGLLEDFLGDRIWTWYTTVVEYQVNENGEIINDSPIAEWGITVSATDITPTGMTLIFTLSGDTLPDALITTQAFYLEALTSTGWEVMKAKDGSNIWEFTARNLLPNRKTEFEIDWSEMYGALNPGTYRICKSVSDHLPTHEGQSYIYSFEFTIFGQDSMP